MRVWFNGAIVPIEEAHVSPLDRGFLFGDGVYEGLRFFAGVGVGMDRHIERLDSSLRATGIRGFEASALSVICEALLQDAGITDALVYLQVTRGVQEIRAHVPEEDLVPTVFAYAVPAEPLSALTSPRAMQCAVVEDQRWARCEIKSISLLGNVLALRDGRDRFGELDEVILQRNGMVSEGAVTNVFAVVDGALVTPPLDGDCPILHGVTRDLLLEAADAESRVEVRPLSVGELRFAQEIMIVSSRRLLDSVCRLDGDRVGAGTIGPVAMGLFDTLKSSLAESCGVTLHS